MAAFGGKTSSNDFVIIDTMSDGEVVASDLPPRYWFTATLRNNGADIQAPGI